MRIARLSLRSSARPRVALERDGIFYDVERLEEELGAAIPIPCDPWDFHTRVAALGCAGLAELDGKLRQGQRPSVARIGPTGFAQLAACDTERAAYLHVDVRRAPELGVRVGHAPSIFGQDALVDLTSDEREPDLEVGVAIIVGEDLRAASAKEARHAIVGCSILADWLGREREQALSGAALTARGTRTQIGPCLVPTHMLPAARSKRVELHVGGRALDAGCLGDLGVSLEDAVAFASRELMLRAGDVVGIGPLPRGSCRAHGVQLEMHQRVEVTVDGLGTLRGAAVPRA